MKSGIRLLSNSLTLAGVETLLELPLLGLMSSKHTILGTDWPPVFSSDVELAPYFRLGMRGIVLDSYALNVILWKRFLFASGLSKPSTEA